MENQNQLSKTSGTNLEGYGTKASTDLTVSEVIQSDLPAIAKLNKEQPEKLFDALVALITDLQLFFNVGKAMDKIQIHETAKIITKEFYFLKLQDLRIAFEKMKAGAYGQLFDRFDGQILCLWLKEYSEERTIIAEQLKLDRQTEMKEAEKEEQYFVRVGENYVRDNGEDFEEVETKELATLFTHNRAWSIKNMLIKFHFTDTPEKVKVTFNKPGIGLMKYLLDNRPDLVEPKTKWKEKTNPYYEKVKLIDADLNMSPHAKENAKRHLAGLAALTLEEFIEREKQKLTPQPKKRKVNK